MIESITKTLNGTEISMTTFNGDDVSVNYGSSYFQYENNSLKLAQGYYDSNGDEVDVDDSTKRSIINVVHRFLAIVNGIMEDPMNQEIDDFENVAF